MFEGHERAVEFHVEMYFSLLCYIIAEINLILQKKKNPSSGKKAWRRSSKHLKFVVELNGVFQEVNMDEMLSAVQLSGTDSMSILSPHLLEAVRFPKLMRIFITVTCPSQSFYAMFAWSVFVGINIVIIMPGSCMSIWKDTILALFSWIREMPLTTFGTQSLFPS